MSFESGEDLFSKILAAFHEACAIGDLAVGRRLLQIAAALHFGRKDLQRNEQADGLQRLMYGHQRLWHLLNRIQFESIVDPPGSPFS